MFRHFSAPLIGLLVLEGFLLNAQASFKSHALERSFFSGIAMGVTDLNGDYWDDLLVLDQGRKLWAGYNDGRAGFLWKKLPLDASIPVWSVNVADLDRNGWADIILGGDSPKFKILYQDSAHAFREEELDHPYFFSQAASLYDIDRDGWIDFTICDDHARTKVFENLAGNLVLNDSWLDLSLPDSSFEAGNYGCLWSDVDQDGDGDLYISKCYAAATEPTDPRRINLYYENGPSGFEEKGKLLGLDCGDQSWVAASGDLNGDGRTDLVVANHYAPSKIYLCGSDGKFQDFSNESGFSSRIIIIQLMLRDMDNDMDLDILACGNGTELWLNDGLGTFSLAEQGLSSMSSLATGDLNGDGYLDLFASHSYLINQPSNRPDRIWLNQGGSNHWLELGLLGMASNPDGIGAIVQVWAGGLKQTRELLCGESYGIQNSRKLHFGLGKYNMADSVVIQWPSGRTDRYDQVDADRFYLLTEGQCMKPRVGLAPSGTRIICVDEEIRLQADPERRGIQWSNGLRTDTILAKETGLYFYLSQDDSVCVRVSELFSLKVNPVEIPRLSNANELIVCQDQKFSLSVAGYDTIFWSDGRSGSSISLDGSGTYSAIVRGACADWKTDTLNFIRMNSPIIPLIDDVLLSGPGQANLISSDSNTIWYDQKEAVVPVHRGGSFLTPVLDQSRLYYARSFVSESYRHLTGGKPYPEFTGSGYHAAALNPRMEFRVFEDIYFDSVTVYTDRPGKRTLQLLDQDLKVLAQSDQILSSGMNRCYLGFFCPGGNKQYHLTTSSDTNMLYLGSVSPRLQRSDLAVRYPYDIADKCRITRSQYGENYYYAFYDWAIRPDDQVCLSEMVEVRIEVGPSDLAPVGNQPCMVELSERKLVLPECMPKGSSIHLFDLSGRKIFFAVSQGGGSDWELPGLVPGLYLIRIAFPDGSFLIEKRFIH
jgi:hypothetical protein